MGEFDLIAAHFAGLTAARADTSLGIGDDAALLQMPPGEHLVVTTDTLVAGRHFLADGDPVALGHKALAVNLSDLAAMGASPAWITLALTLPAADDAWLTGLARGLGDLAAQHNVQLIGGDTTRGPLALTLTALGRVPHGQALRRAGARPGDLIYVSGQLGDAALALLARQGLYVTQGEVAALNARLDRPTPRVALGLALRGLASAAIDLSDGLGSDLGHLCRASGVGATLHLDQLPRSRAVQDYITDTGDWALPLSGGDDYELCFTVPPARQAEIEALAQQLGLPLTWIGLIQSGHAVQGLQPDGELLSPLPGGFDHFTA